MEVAFRPDTPPGRRGLTLVETTLALLVTGLLVVMALNAFSSLARARKTAADHYQGVAMARALLAEALAGAYQEPDDTPVLGPEAGETRAAFDDVDDYDGLSESPPRSRDGAALPNATGWRRTASVAWADLADPDKTAAGETGLKRITVTVTGPQGKTVTLTALRGATGADEAQYEEPTEYVAGVVAEVQVGSDPAGRIAAGAAILNRVPSGD